ncbi:hypothetical protein [Okeania sp. SIO2F5]|nr:hypothetical protein [Okeania sp. SIO2F5]
MNFSRKRENYYLQHQKTPSIWDFGKNPVECNVTDGAINHDSYLYNQQ